MRTTVIVAAAVACFVQSAIAEAGGDHPAVQVKRMGAGSVLPAYLKFYMHPAGLQLLAAAPSARDAESGPKLAHVQIDSRSAAF